MRQTLSVANIMCNGCANTITGELGLLDGVSGIDVEVASGKVSFDADPAKLDAIKVRLAALGYPEKGAVPAAGVTSLADLVAKAKTFAR